MKQILAFRHARKPSGSKVVPGDVTLAFLPRAEIDMAGPDGMGTSTLLQMMAGLEQPSSGEVLLMPGYRVGILPFGFKGSNQQKLAGLMSGGERGRVNLALTLKQGGNLLLDEPASDLDVETLALLEDALGEFPGCAVIISYDRWFPGRVATHILAWEGGANWFWSVGSFASYEKNKAGRLGEEAARPHRVTHRKLAR